MGLPSELSKDSVKTEGQWCQMVNRSRKRKMIVLLIWSLGGYPGFKESSIITVAREEESKGEPTLTSPSILEVN